MWAPPSSLPRIRNAFQMASYGAFPGSPFGRPRASPENADLALQSRLRKSSRNFLDPRETGARTHLRRHVLQAAHGRLQLGRGGAPPGPAGAGGRGRRRGGGGAQVEVAQLNRARAVLTAEKTGDKRCHWELYSGWLPNAEDVLWLQIPVGDTPLVQKLECSFRHFFEPIAL